MISRNLEIQHYNDGIIENLNRHIDRLPPPKIIAQRNNECFDEIPIRRVDVLQAAGCSLISAAYFDISNTPTSKKNTNEERVSAKSQLLSFALVRQFSPPSSMAPGEYRWSILRFAVLSATPSLPLPYFDVTVLDVDVGTDGPFSVVTVNKNRTRCCVYSPLSSFCTVFDLPFYISPGSTITSKVLKYMVSIDSIRWHPLDQNILGVLDRRSSSLIVFDFSSNITAPAATMPVDLNSIDFDFIRIPQSERNSKHVGAVCLTTSGSTSIVSCALKGQRYCHGQKSDMQTLQILPKEASDLNKSPEYTSILVIRHGSLMIFGRLSQEGKLEIFGTDLRIDFKTNSSCSYETPLLLDILQLQLPIGPVPRLHLGCDYGYRDQGLSNSGPDNSSIKVASGVSGPYVFVSTAEELIIVELLWISQIEELPTLHTASAPPSLIPSNAQIIFSTFDTTTSPKSNKTEEDVLILGFAQVQPHSTLFQAPRLIILKACLVPETPGPDVSVAVAGWDVCDIWDLVEIDLKSFIATNQVVEKYVSDIEDVWSILGEIPAVKKDTLRKSLENQQANSTTLQYRHALHALGKSFKDLSIPPSVFTDVNLSSADTSYKPKDPVFTFKVNNGMAVDLILEKLEVAGCRLSRLIHFRNQFISLQEQLATLAFPAIALKVDEKTEFLKKDTERLCNRIEQVQAQNDKLTRQFKALLPSLILVLDLTRAEALRTAIIPSLKNANDVVAIGLGQSIIQRKSSLVEDITTELLVNQPELLRTLIQPKVEMLIAELCEVLRQRPPSQYS